VRVVKVPKDEWAKISEGAHLIVFNETKKAESDRIDFALVVESEHGIMMQYGTCREVDAESLYIQYGGSFPGTKGSVNSHRCFEAILTWAREQGYRRVSFLVENTNEPMLKLALRTGFLIVGIRNFRKKSILLEHVKEFADLEVE